MSCDKVLPFSATAAVEEDALAALEKRIEALEAKSSSGGGDEDSRGGDAPESPYCFVIGVLLDPDSSWMSRAVAFVLILVLTFIQIALCFAFADTSELMNWQGSYSNLYATAIPMGNFYTMGDPSTSKVNAAGVPRMTMVTGYIAILLLCVSVQNALSHTSLLAVSPVEYLFFLAPRRVWDTPQEVVYNVIVLAVLELIFIIRLSVLPVMVIYGSIQLWTSEGTATDIVKDSVVVTYVIELDGLVYSFAAEAVRKTYEDSPGYALAPGRKSAAFDLGKWAIYIIDFFSAIELFNMYQGVSEKDTAGACFYCGKTGLTMLMHYSLLRSTAFILGSTGCILSSNEHAAGLYSVVVAQMPSSTHKFTKGLGLLISGGAILCFAPLTGEIWVTLVDIIGWNAVYGIDAGGMADLTNCMAEYHRSKDCLTLNLYS